jgi:hypothetical protein
MVKTSRPARKILLRPMMSAYRPDGTIKTAAEMIYADVIQQSVTASTWNCAAIAGRATVIDDPVYGTRNEDSDATRRMIFFSRSSTMGHTGSELIMHKVEHYEKAEVSGPSDCHY